MMTKITKKDIILLVIQLTVWGVVLSLPPITSYVITGSVEYTLTTAVVVWGILRSPFVLYFLNFYLFGPYLFFKRRFKSFVLANLATLGALNYGFFLIRNSTEAHEMHMPDNAWIGFFAGIFSYLLLNFIIIATAIGIRHFLNVRKIKKQLDEERQKNTEAELAWLKSQINPHFLFNTLNNISSLTQIDPDAAQDAIAQLSDLLRYAIYETNKALVPINGEVEFMTNYVELMKLRCNEKTKVTTYFDVQQNVMVAPLLFISLIENAFKHGVSSSKMSHINISLVQEGEVLSFVCENSNYPKDDKDRSGSGIGLENTRRRLELMYQGRYEWEQSENEKTFYVKISVRI